MHVKKRTYMSEHKHFEMINDGNKFIISFGENLLGMIEHHAYSMFEKSIIGDHLSGLMVYYCMFRQK